jgi:hypothetical protein
MCTRCRKPFQSFRKIWKLQWNVYGWMTMFKNGFTSVADEEKSGCPSTFTTEKALNAYIPWFWKIPELLSMKWCIVWASVMVLLMESFKTVVDFITFVQDGFQNNSQESTSTNIRQSAKAYWIAVMLFEMHCHWGWDVAPPLCSRRWAPGYGMETSDHQSKRS